jgi:cytochrome c-type biogenesis protein CcmH
MFYAIAALMVLGALAFVLVPLLKKPTKRLDRLTVEAANLEAFRVQRRELDADFQRGLITAEERDRVLEELSARLSFELAPEQLGSKTKPDVARGALGENVPKRSWILGVALSTFILGGTATGYSFWGAHEARDLANAGNAQAASVNVDPNAPLSDKQVLALVENLAKKMEENPSDPKGWILLARSQNALGQWGAAASAFERAVTLLPNDAQLLADYADVQAMVQEGNFTGKPMALIQRALKADPDNLKALALAGTAEMRANNKTQSLKHWEKLKALLPKDSDDFTQVSAIITEIKTGKPAFPQDAPAATSPASVPKAPQTAAAPPSAAMASGRSVSGEVTVDPAVASKIAKGDTLFVFARAVNGPRMPLAILRAPVPGSWPFRFSLDDSMAMAPGMNLSAFAEVVIEARISKAGMAALQPGDLQGVTPSIRPPANALKVLIDKVAP